MVNVYKDICYANIADVDQYNCYLDLYLPDSTNNVDLYSKVNQYSDRFRNENESRDGSVTRCSSDTSELLETNKRDYELERDATEKKSDVVGSERSVKDTDESRLPFVLFIHGGGWRRGGRAAWKHYLYFDVNFIVSFLQYFAGTYDNIGRTLAENNVPCAVVSYPLTEASWWVLLAEMFLSYIQCLAFVFILCVPILGISALYKHISHTDSFFCWKPFDVDQSSINILTTLFFLTMFLTNVITGVLFIWKRIEFGLTLRQMVCFGAITVCFSSIALMSNVPNAPVLNIALVTLIVNQCIIFMIRYRRSGSSFESQVQAVAQAVRWAKRLSQYIDVIDERQLYLMGHSAGGHLATLYVLDDSILTSVACTSNDLKGIISVSGVYDLLCLNNHFLRPLYLHPTFGRSFSEWKNASPEHRVKTIQKSKDLPKFLLVCAEKDLFLKPQSYTFSETLCKMNVDCKHVEIQGTNHFTIITDTRTESGSPLSHVLEFVKA